MLLIIKLLPKKKKPILNFKRRVYVYLKEKKLAYGYLGYQINSIMKLTAKHASKIYIFLKKITRRGTKKRKYFWFKMFPSTILTKKTIGSRMGKGKGKFKNWVVILLPGWIFYELKNIKFSIFSFFHKQLIYKLSVSVKKIISIFFYKQKIKFSKFPNQLTFLNIYYK